VNAVDQAGNVTSTLNLGEFEVDLSLHEPTDFLSAIEELGYAKFSGSASGKASWDPRNGHFAVTPFHVRIKDAGNFEFSTAISGATREFGHSLGRFMEDDDRSNVAILGPVANLSLERFDILYEDASLGGRLVDFYADMTHLPAKGSWSTRPKFWPRSCETWRTKVSRMRSAPPFRSC
jgi:hypothetical protein